MAIENNDRDEKSVSSSKLMMVNFLPRFQVGNYPFLLTLIRKKQALTEPDK